MTSNKVLKAHDPRADGSSPPPPDFKGRMIEVLVGQGEDHASITVHENSLRSNSKFFEAALSRDWKENNEAKVTLPEEEMKYMEVYASWVYTHRIHANNLTGQPKPCSEYSFEPLFRLYGLGVRMQDYYFQDALIDVAIAQMMTKNGQGERYIPCGQALRRLYMETIPSDPIRRLFVHMYVRFGHESWFTVELSALNFEFEFMNELMRAFYRYKKSKVLPTVIDPKTGTCAYHHHVEGGLCYSRKRTREQAK